MNSDLSQTQVYYQLIDLDAEEKQAYLNDLQLNHPDIYADVLPLVEAENSPHLTELLNFNIYHTGLIEQNYLSQQVDKYLITHELGRGGMGVVYSACRADKRFEQKLAIKFLHHNLANVFDESALFSEAQLLARLSHPNIAKVFDGGIHDQQVYIVMEQVEGVSLAELCAQKNFSKEEKLNFFIQICNGIEHTHSHAIIHGDLKPENILVDDNGHAKLIDFNLTQNFDHITNPILAFSHIYASPEQKAGLSLSPSSDIYSLGKLLSWLFPDVRSNSDIHYIFKKATQHDSNKRYSTAAQLRLDIERMRLNLPISLRKKELTYVAQRLFNRHPISSSLAIILLLSASIFSSVLIGKKQQLEHEKRVAENLIYEVTSMMFDAKSQDAQSLPVSVVLDLTRRRILSNPEIPKHIKQKMLLAMMAPSERTTDK